MMAFASTVKRGVATRSTFGAPVHDNSEEPEFVVQSGEVVVEELGDVPPGCVAGEVVVEEDDDVPADLADDPPTVSVSTTATATMTLGTA
jgi:hypothetical protein